MQYNEHLVRLMGEVQIASNSDGPEDLKRALLAVAALQRHLETSANTNWVELHGALAENYVATLKWLLSEVEERMSGLRESGATNELLKSLKEQKSRLEDELAYPAYQVFSNVQPFSRSRYYKPPKPEPKTNQAPRQKIKAPKPPGRERGKPEIETSFVSNPLLGVALTLFFGACAFSGKFSITATWIFLVATWGVVCLLFWQTAAIRSRRCLHSGLVFLSAVALVLFALWLEPQKVGASAGVVSSERELFSSSHPVKVRFEIGQSGDIAEITGPTPAFNFLFSKNSVLRIEVLDGKLLVSTQMRDSHGNLIAEVIQNEWRVSPAAWDKNYNDNAFEVRNAEGKIVLQVRVLPDRIQLQGDWPTGNGHFVRLVDSGKHNVPVGSRGLILQYDGKDDPHLPQIKPLFQYPSDLHLGELVAPPSLLTRLLRRVGLPR